MEENSNERNRRTFQGLIVNRQTQFKLAVSCTSLILLPTLITSTTLIVNLALEATKRSQTPISAAQLAEELAQKAFTYGLINLAVFVVLSLISIIVSLKLSNHMIGPVARLEKHVRQMIEGNYTAKTNLRQNDYLRPLGERLDELSEKLSAK